MLKGKYERIVDQFELYYTRLFQHTVDWWPSGRLCITVKLDDGLMFEFDSYDNSIRKVQANNNVNDVDTLRRNIGYNIQKAIQTRGMPQNDVADKSGVTQAMLSRYIHGKSTPSIDKLYCIANVLGCRVSDLLGELSNED